MPNTSYSLGTSCRIRPLDTAARHHLERDSHYNTGLNRRLSRAEWNNSGLYQTPLEASRQIFRLHLSVQLCIQCHACFKWLPADAAWQFLIFPFWPRSCLTHVREFTPKEPPLTSRGRELTLNASLLCPQREQFSNICHRLFRRFQRDTTPGSIMGVNSQGICCIAFSHSSFTSSLTLYFLVPLPPKKYLCLRLY